MNTSVLNLEFDARCEVCPLSRVRAGVAVRIRKLCATPEMQERLREIFYQLGAIHSALHVRVMAGFDQKEGAA